MAEYGNQQVYPALIADYDWTSAQYTIAVANSYGTPSQPHISLSTSGGPLTLGVVQNAPNSGQFATVAYAGPSKVVAGAAISYGTLLTCDGSGRAIACVSGSYVIGRAIEGAAAAGNVISAVLFAVGGRQVA